MNAIAAPLRNNNKMKLGIFSSNVSGGGVMTTAEGTLSGTWDEQVAIAQATDQAGWEFLLPVGRWRGFGGPSNLGGRSFEVFTWASALTAVTKQIQVLATAHVPLVHPMLAAKQSATIDQIGNGRFGLNVVAGWNDDEMGMFGVAQLDHDERYHASAEWLTVVKRLWTEADDFDFNGKHFTIKSGQLDPKPVQQPHPVIVNAGQSSAGMRFGAEHADFSFQSGQTVESLAARAVAARTAAREEFDRDLGILTFGYVVCRDTEAEARDYVRHYVDECGDFVAAQNLINRMLRGKVESIPRDVMVTMQRQYIAGWGGMPLVGTPEQIVGRLVELSNVGVNGIGLIWVDYHAGIEQFNAQVLPLMVDAGLRSG